MTREAVLRLEVLLYTALMTGMREGELRGAPGQPYSSANLNRALRRLLTKAGLGSHLQPGNLMRFHDLRKSAASILSAIGFSIPEIMAILGHKIMRMTADVYAQAHPRNRRAADALDGLFAASAE
jgi:integrase